MRRLLTSLAFLALALPASAQAARKPPPAKSGRQKIEFGTSYYVLNVPAGYKPAQKHGIIFMFHGSGGRPESYESNYAAAKNKGYLLCLPASTDPQGYSDDDMKQIVEIALEVLATYSIDRDRVFVSGHSAGGFVTCHLCSDHPEIFTAGAPVSGCLVNDAMARPMLKTPFYVVSGGKDFNHNQSKQSVEDMRKAGMEVKFDEPPEWAHNPPAEAWQRTFEWMEGLVPPDCAGLLQGARALVEAKQYGKAAGALKKLAGAKSIYAKNRAELIGKLIDEAAEKELEAAGVAGDAKKAVELLKKAKAAFAGSDAAARIEAALEEYAKAAESGK
ncbi:MAG: alpha/beta fold hydrolase [Planctomycetes bacterium]|nr:alpha/beta fold hydrolase [Planctomycetota bacterium]